MRRKSSLGGHTGGKSITIFWLTVLSYPACSQNAFIEVWVNLANKNRQGEEGQTSESKIFGDAVRLPAEDKLQDGRLNCQKSSS
uniref:Uncharacterized protein n=1 Tax=Romanomermis culicivorax TaxID=13658 RepID=A0A915IG54_ROMCU